MWISLITSRGCGGSEAVIFLIAGIVIAVVLIVFAFVVMFMGEKGRGAQGAVDTKPRIEESSDKEW